MTWLIAVCHLPKDIANIFCPYRITYYRACINFLPLCLSRRNTIIQHLFRVSEQVRLWLWQQASAVQAFGTSRLVLHYTIVTAMAIRIGSSSRPACRLTPSLLSSTEPAKSWVAWNRAAETWMVSVAHACEGQGKIHLKWSQFIMAGAANKEQVH